MDTVRFFALLSHTGWGMLPLVAVVVFGFLIGRLRQAWQTHRHTALLVALVAAWGLLLLNSGLCLAGLLHFGCAAIKARQSQCLSNVKQLGTAMMMYAQDHDEKFPPGGQWSRQLQSYLKARLVCPEAKTPISYSMNRAMSTISMNALEFPGDTVLLFEADVPTGSAADRKVMRHGGSSHIGFADGHAKWTNPTTTLRWKPGSEDLP